jgi:hypothetical protein
MGEAVAACPKGALGTRLTVGIVHAFFMQTAYDAVDCGHGTDLMLTEKGLDLLSDGVVVADVAILGKPALELLGLVSFVGDDRHGNLGSQGRGGTLEGDGGDRITLESTLGFLGHPGWWALDFPHLSMEYAALWLRQGCP